MPSGDCPHTNGCQMYQFFKNASFLEIWKLQYCRGEFTKCERYTRSQRGEPIPPTLLPNGTLLQNKAARE